MTSRAKVYTQPLPQAARILANMGDGDFIDGFSVKSNMPIAEALAKAFNMPRWASVLMRLRNMLMRPFGLKTDKMAAPKPGAKASLFPIQYQSPDEVIIGTDDRHLNFRITLIRHGDLIHMGTWVRPHNWLGRCYLAIVMPFHNAICRQAMKSIAKHSSPITIPTKREL